MSGDDLELTVPNWLKQRAGSHAAAPALLGATTSGELDFAKLNERVCAVADEFRSYGIGRGSPVAVALTDGPETLILILALMSVGAVVPIHPAAAEMPVERLVEKVGVSAIVGGERPASAAWRVAEKRGLTYIAVRTDSSRLGAVHLTPHRETPALPSGDVGLDDIALFISTSGTTGASSIVSITHRSLDRNVFTHGLINGYGPGTRAICVMPFTFLFAYVRAALPMLRHGGAVAVAPGYRFADLQRWCETLKPTCMAATPTILRKIIADSAAADWRPAPPVLQQFHATGEAIPESLRVNLRDRFGATLGSNYGMTEVSPQVTIAQPDDQLPPQAAGRIVSPWQVDILDDHGAVLPSGDVGRIALRGGYVNAVVGMSRETRRDEEGRFLTGDRGFLDEDDVLYIVGRVDDVINRGGEKIDPRIIERAIELDPDVKRAVVFAVPDPAFGQKILGLVVLRDGASRDARQIREAAGARISGWGVPERLIAVGELPTNANGKVSRSELARRHADAG